MYCRICKGEMLTDTKCNNSLCNVVYPDKNYDFRPPEHLWWYEQQERENRNAR